MPLSKATMKQIEKDVVESLRVPTIVIDGNNPIALVRAPVNIGVTAIPRGHIDVDRLMDVEDLPLIPERQRDFAYRYATEYRGNDAWAAEYGVHKNTIFKWLHDERVKLYIAKTRYDMRFYNFAQRTILNRRVYQTINAILSMRLNEDTVDAISKMTQFVWKVLNEPQAVRARQKEGFNIQVGINNQIPPPNNPYKIEDVSSQAPVGVPRKKLEEVQAELEKLKEIADDYGVDI